MERLHGKIYVTWFGLRVIIFLLCSIECDVKTVCPELERDCFSALSLGRSHHGERYYGRRGIIHVINQWKALKSLSRMESDLEYQAAVRLRFHKNGKKMYEIAGGDQKTLKNSGCSQEDKFSFILHGWKQNCDTDWVLQLIERLTFYRGGCVICIDFGKLAQASYMRLYRQFKKISNIVAKRMLNLIKEGMSPEKAYIFGFSYGGQLATAVGRYLSKEYLIMSIDTCDMAGPGFDLFTDLDHREAARNVQCLHTSRDKGTKVYTCHQSVRLGSCGHYQPAAISQPYYSSHGLCAQIYINAFDYPFYAMLKKPHWCTSTKSMANLTYKYTIGYRECPDFNIRGEIFVPTSLNFPYNLSVKEMTALGYFK